MSLPRALALASLAAAVFAILLFPSDAQAWGPLAHLNFSAQVLGQLGTVGPSIRGLLEDFGSEFLYGSLAADIVVGKNMARYLYHCHNWRVGFHVFDRAESGAEQAFALGFLSHLAADTVAHNYYVPWKTVASYGKIGARHAYWELRYDQRMDAGMSRLARKVTTRAVREHDLFLKETLAHASVLPFGVSRQLFRSLLASARLSRFQNLSRVALAPGRGLPLEADLVAETDALAVRAILGVLADGEKAAAARADATGARNIQLAQDLRRQLQQRLGERRITAANAEEIVAETRASFRRGIQGKLVLPRSVGTLAA